MIETSFPIGGMSESSGYLHVSPLPNLLLKLMEVKRLPEFVPSTSLKKIL